MLWGDIVFKVLSFAPYCSYRSYFMSDYELDKGESK